jgi:drug/metabolite transporter (DMT)-like permease
MDKKVLGTLLMLVTAVLYGLEPILAKAVLQDSGALDVQFIRCAIAAVLLVPFLAFEKINLKKGSLRNAAILGFIGMGIASTLYYLGLKLTGGLDAILIERSYPFLVFILSVIFLKEVITRRKIVGSSLVILGTFVVILEGFAGGGASLIGDLLVVGAMLTWAVWIIIAKMLVTDTNELFLAFIGFIMGAISVFIYAGGLITPVLSPVMLGLGVLSALAWVFYFKALKLITASKATVIESTAPFFTFIFTIVIMSSIPSFYGILATFVIIAGLLLLSRED